MKISPLQVCIEGLNWEADKGARFDCLSKETKGETHPQVRTEGPHAVKMSWSAVHMEMSAFQSKHDMWKDSRAGDMTHLLVEGPDSEWVVVNAACGREAVREVGDVQAHGGDIWVKEATCRV